MKLDFQMIYNMSVTCHIWLVSAILIRITTFFLHATHTQNMRTNIILRIIIHTYTYLYICLNRPSIFCLFAIVLSIYIIFFGSVNRIDLNVVHCSTAQT